MKNILENKCKHTKYHIMEDFKEASLNRCENCGLAFYDKDNRNDNPEELYEDFYKEDTGGRFNIITELIVRGFRFLRALKIVAAVPKAKSILDIGSGRGYMLYYLKKIFKFNRTAGTQISKHALEFSRDTLGLEIYGKDLLELSLYENSFEVVTMWHVLEHVNDPEGYIEKIAELLYYKGKIIVEVPNFSSWTRKMCARYWLSLDFDHHITFFTPEALCALLEKYNFNIKKVRTFSLEYSTFTSVQSLVSRFTQSDHLFYKALQGQGGSIKLLLHIILFVLLTPICFLINILLWFSKRGEVLRVVAEKN